MKNGKGTNITQEMSKFWQLKIEETKSKLFSD